MTTPHDPPSVAELLDAVRSFLTDEVMARTDGRLRFHARVASNALAMVERELALGVEQTERHRTRLERLGFTDDATLAEAIRSGALDDRYDAVASAVREMILDKLLIANPGYADEGE